MVRLKHISLFLIFISTFYAQAIKVEATTDTSEYFVGDYIQYKLRVVRDKNINFEMPSVIDSINSLEFIKDLGVTEYEKDDKLISEFKYIFSCYDSTEIIIPSFFIPYIVGADTSSRLVASNEVYLVVKTMQVNPEQGIADIKAPLLIPVDWLIVISVIVAILVLALAAYFIFRYYRKKKLAAAGNLPEVVLSPFEEAMLSLKKLEDDHLLEQGLIKEYHSEITRIVRKYFERKFNFFALEMPSSEILYNLKNVNEAGVVFDITNKFLTNADMVKFAKFVPMASVNEEMLRQAYEIVNKTGPELVPEEKIAEVENV